MKIPNLFDISISIFIIITGVFIMPTLSEFKVIKAIYAICILVSAVYFIWMGIEGGYDPTKDKKVTEKLK